MEFDFLKKRWQDLTADFLVVVLGIVVAVTIGN